MTKSHSVEKRQMNTFRDLVDEKVFRRFTISLFILFGLMVLGRLSAFTDVAFTNLGLDLFNRLNTKIVWLLGYFLIVLYFAFYLFKFRKQLKGLYLNFILTRKISLIVLSVFFILMLITIPFAFKVSEAIAGGVYYGILLSIPVFIWFILSGVDKHILNKVSYRFVGFITTILAVFTALQYWAYSFGGAQNLIIKFFDEHGGFMPVSFFTFEYGATSVIRPSSLMGDPNFLAVFLATLAIIGVDFIVKKFKEEKRVDWIMIGFLFLNLANIFVSGSRSGILVLIVEVVVYFSGNLLFKKQFFAVTAFGNLFARFKDALTLKDASTIQHLDFAKTAIEMFKQKPIFGVGIANYPYYFWEYFNSQAGFATPHSIYFQFLAETGLLGFIGLIGVIIYIAQNLIKNKNILYLSIFAGFLVGNITYGYFMTPWVWFYIGLFLL